MSSKKATVDSPTLIYSESARAERIIDIERIGVMSLMFKKVFNERKVRLCMTDGSGGRISLNISNIREYIDFFDSIINNQNKKITKSERCRLSVITGPSFIINAQRFGMVRLGSGRDATLKLKRIKASFQSWEPFVKAFLMGDDIDLDELDKTNITQLVEKENRSGIVILKHAGHMAGLVTLSTRVNSAGVKVMGIMSKAEKGFQWFDHNNNFKDIETGIMEGLTAEGDMLKTFHFDHGNCRLFAFISTRCFNDGKYTNLQLHSNYATYNAISLICTNRHALHQELATSFDLLNKI